MKIYNKNDMEKYLKLLNKTSLTWPETNTENTDVLECVCGACACGGGRKYPFPRGE